MARSPVRPIASVEAITSGRGARIATANLDFVALARRDATLREDLANSTLVVADGKPIVWLARIAGARRIGRVNGVDLATELLRRGEALGGMRVALYGSTPDISRDAAAWIERTFVGVRIVAQLTPPFRELSEQESLAERARLTAAAPDLVLVALGCPRQERLIARYFDAAPGAVWIGIGGTLDFFAGRRWRAPRFVQAAGLEWAFRLMQEPRRLWRRYLLRDLPTLFCDCARMRAHEAGAAAGALPVDAGSTAHQRRRCTLTLDSHERPGYSHMADIAVIGCGHVGLVTAACFAKLGHNVECIDIDERRVAALQRGECPIHEPGLAELLREGAEAGRLQFMATYPERLRASIVFIAVNTPASQEGAADLRAVRDAVGTVAAAAALRRHHRQQEHGAHRHRRPRGGHGPAQRRTRHRVVSNPEFLREGSAVHDFMRPDRVVLGSNDAAAAGAGGGALCAPRAAPSCASTFARRR